jgi:hypothetical protein
MKNLRLRWSDGRETIVEFDNKPGDSTGDTLAIPASDGIYHQFRASSDTDDDGLEVFIEEQE